MENNSIDKTFSEASKNLEEPATFPGFDKVWAKVEEKLEKKETKRKTIGLLIPYGIAACLLIGSGIFYFTGKKENTAVQQQTIARQIVSPKNQPAEIPGHILKTDSTVKAKIRNEMPAVPTPKMAYQKVPETDASQAISPVPRKQLPEVFPLEKTDREENKIKMDTAKRRNTEEVIAMGIRKEKISMVNALSAVSSSSSRKKISELNAVADTAEATYPASVFNHTEPLQEPQILAYNKGYLNKNRSVASAQTVLGNRIGNKETVAGVLRGAVPGVNINSISGSPGSGKVDISISCQGSVKSNNNPLFIIDGKETDSEAFKKIDPEKIESIRIFKGEKAASIFGSKAARGAVLVETKYISRKAKRTMKKLFKEGSQP